MGERSGIGDLDNKVLLQVKIFECLPMDCRVRIERVSPRWQLLVRRHGWCNFHHLSLTDELTERIVGRDEDHEQIVARTAAWLYSMFNRCGPHLTKVEFSSYSPLSQQVCALLSRVPNVSQLSLHDTSGGAPMLRDEQLEEIEKVLPKLKSLSVNGYTLITFTRLTNSAPLASRLTELCLWNIESSVLSVACAFPELKHLMVDMCFDFLPLISRVAETSPLLEKLYMYELGVLYYDYDPQTQQMVTDSLQAAVTRMAELKKFTMYGTCYLSERVNDILRDVADRLEEYAVVGIQTWEVLQFALSSCRSLRRLCVANYICKPEPMEFRCELVQLTSLVLIGACKGNYWPSDVISHFQNLSHLHTPCGLLRYTVVCLAVDERGGGSLRVCCKDGEIQTFIPHAAVELTRPGPECPDAYGELPAR